jgi:hypothetical protein
MKPERQEKPRPSPSTNRSDLPACPVDRLRGPSLAKEFCQAAGTNPLEEICIAEVGESVDRYLARLGRPGRWVELDVRAYLRGGVLPGGMAPEGVLFFLAALVGHAGLTHQLPARAAKRMLQDIADLSRDGACREFATWTATRLHQLSF